MDGDVTAIPAAPALSTPSPQPAQAGLITSPLGEVGQGAMNLDTLPSTVSQRENPLGTIEQIGRGLENLKAYTGVTLGDDMGALGGFGAIAPDQPESVVPKADLQQYNVKGPTPGLSLTISGDMPESVAKNMHDAKLDEIARANAAARSPAGVGSTLADLGYGFLDPVGIAASALPVFGEARMGALLGKTGIDLGESLLGRTVLRGAAGLVDAATANAPLVGLKYGLGQQEQADYSMSDAARDLAYGSLLGGVLHPLIGGVGDAFGALRGSSSVQALDANPDMRAATAQASISAVMEDRPVDAAPMGDLAVAQADNENAKAALRTELLRTAGDATALRGEAQAVPAGAPVDPATQARIEAVEDDLTQPGALPAARQAQLESEMSLLTEGQQAADTDLERGRSDAQRAGLIAAADRAEQRVKDIQEQLLSSPTARQAQGEPTEEQTAIQGQADSAAKGAPVQNDSAPPNVTEQTTRLRGMIESAREQAAVSLEPDVTATENSAAPAIHQQIAKAMFETDTPTPEQVAHVRDTVAQVATERGWTAEQTNAALGAVKQVGADGRAQSIQDYADELNRRADGIATAGDERSGNGVAQRGAVDAETSGSAAGAADTIRPGAGIGADAELSTLRATGRLDPQTKMELASVEAAQLQSQNRLAALAQAVSCIARGVI